MMTDEEYVANGGLKCPNCEEQELIGESVEIGRGKAYQQISCAACNANFVDHYVLLGYGELDLSET